MSHLKDFVWDWVKIEEVAVDSKIGSWMGMMAANQTMDFTYKCSLCRIRTKHLFEEMTQICITKITIKEHCLSNKFLDYIYQHMFSLDAAHWLKYKTIV